MAIENLCCFSPVSIFNCLVVTLIELGKWISVSPCIVVDISSLCHGGYMSASDGVLFSGNPLCNNGAMAELVEPLGNVV